MRHPFDEVHANGGRSVPTKRKTANPSANDRMHSGVYRWLAALYGIMLLILWGIFRNAWEALFMLVICAFYFAMYFGTPYVMLRAGKVDMRDTVSWSYFLRSPFQTNTGSLKGWEALVQVCTIPAAIVLGFAGFALVFAFVR